MSHESITVNPDSLDQALDTLDKNGRHIIAVTPVVEIVVKQNYLIVHREKRITTVSKPTVREAVEKIAEVVKPPHVIFTPPEQAVNKAVVKTVYPPSGIKKLDFEKRRLQNGKIKVSKLEGRYDGLTRYDLIYNIVVENTPVSFKEIAIKLRSECIKSNWKYITDASIHEALHTMLHNGLLYKENKYYCLPERKPDYNAHKEEMVEAASGGMVE